MEWCLKLHPKFAHYLIKGEKKLEFRKIDKAYIRKGDIITFIDLESKRVFCKREVIKSEIVTYSKAYNALTVHDRCFQEVRSFMNKNYINESHLLCLHLQE